MSFAFDSKTNHFASSLAMKPSPLLPAEPGINFINDFSNGNSSKKLHRFPQERYVFVICITIKLLVKSLKNLIKFVPEDDGVAAEGVVAGLGSSIVRRLAVSFRQFW